MIRLMILLSLCFLPAMALARDNLKLIYYAKPDDPDVVGVTLENWSKSRDASLIFAKPNPNYSGREIFSNAILCGEHASLPLVLDLFDELSSGGVDIYYFGKYYNPELNSRRNSIDVRTIGGEDYSSLKVPLQISDFRSLTQRQVCGLGAGLTLERVIVENPNKSYTLSGVLSKDHAEALRIIYSNRGRRVEVEESEGGFILKIDASSIN